MSSYAAAITWSKSSGFIHETGLACELAGLYHKKSDQLDIALNFFQSAKDSYLRWGSNIKVESMTEKINGIVSAQA